MKRFKLRLKLAWRVWRQGLPEVTAWYGAKENPDGCIQPAIEIKYEGTTVGRGDSLHGVYAVNGIFTVFIPDLPLEVTFDPPATSHLEALAKTLLTGQ